MARLVILCCMLSCFLINHVTALKNAQFGQNNDTSEKMVVDSTGSSAVWSNTSEVSSKARKKPMNLFSPPTAGEHVQEIGRHGGALYDMAAAEVKRNWNNIGIQRDAGLYVYPSGDANVWTIISPKLLMKDYMEDVAKIVRSQRLYDMIMASVAEAPGWDTATPHDVFFYAYFDGGWAAAKLASHQVLEQQQDGQKVKLAHGDIAGSWRANGYIWNATIAMEGSAVLADLGNNLFDFRMHTVWITPPGGMFTCLGMRKDTTYQMERRETSADRKIKNAYNTVKDAGQRIKRKTKEACGLFGFC